VQPLSDLLVLDFTTLLPGPLATLLLAEAGAEVIKIERPGGDAMRDFPPGWDGMGAAFAMLNRGKASLVLDLKRKADQARLRPLLARADILVEQFRPGVMAALGLGYAAVRALNPGIIYCSISGYGQSGPRAGEAGHDLNYVGATGLLALQPGPAGRPVVPPALVADIGGGSFPAVVNILLALRQRERTGAGCHLDIAMTDAMFTYAWNGLAMHAATGRTPTPGELPLVGAAPRYRLYPTSDGRLVACGALEQKFWLAFCTAIGLAPDLVDDMADPESTTRAVAGLIAGRSAQEWRAKLAKADCCATVVASLEEAMADPHFVQRGLFAHRVIGAGGASISALPVPIDPQFREIPGEKPAPALTPAPDLGMPGAQR
jgi:crotonobetainyl-CoA:carnitine CoA-transferase CaiB-like acyl-CoA transferase